MKRNENLFQLLKKDHRLVSSLFSKISKTKENAGKTREKLYLELRENLDLHARAEEAVVYPLLKEREKTKDIGYEAVEEHAIVKFLFSKIDAEEPTSDEWMAQVCVLQEVVDHHVEEEEDEMFKKMEKAFSEEEIAEMGRQFVEFKESGGVQTKAPKNSKHHSAAQHAAA
jgi:hemerythrin superfamily protein